jgi:hypothetical protein
LTALILVSAYLFLLALATATAKGASPVAMTERGSAVLVWLERHPKAGALKLRNRRLRPRDVVEARFKTLVWRGLRLAGVAWLDYHIGDINPGSPFGCIHGNEANWRDAGDPHWGGLQMDGGFMDTYGADYQRAFHGLADRWPIWAQVNAAYRAYHGFAGYGARGYGPWPNTGRACGLL